MDETPSAVCVALERDGTTFAQSAVQFDETAQHDIAIFYYNEAIQALFMAKEEGSRIPNIDSRIKDYAERVHFLKEKCTNVKSTKADRKTPQQLDLERAAFLVQQAFEEDEKENKEEAVELYTQAVELCIKVRQETNDSSLQERVINLAKQALDRAEILKGCKKETPQNIPTTSSTSVGTISGKTVLKDRHTRKVVPPLGFGAFKDDNEKRKAKSPTAGTSSCNVSGPGVYSKEEINVLRHSSFINKKEYVPFMSVDKLERFAFPLPMTDKYGKLTLSPKQKENFVRWARPEEFCDNPKMIYTISSFSIRQTIVSDCSFVASLAISAQYERRFKKKLITSIIYPQNKLGEPIYNPCGKYMIKLHLNGVPRKVIIDDYLPLGRNSELLCSFSNNRSELWVSLLEKAYMKVMGGYDFPGSNSNIDLNALTGWIPERISIVSTTSPFDKDKVFKRIYERFHKGDCLVTMSTGDISESEAERAGLVPTHAYAMLDIKEVKGRRLFMLKNPWNHLRWKGRFSEHDTKHWTPEMQSILNYDPKSAQSFDNGVFWIDYESICHFYEVIHINWNPELFKHTTCIHSAWQAREGPKKDSYNISFNPQYHLEVKSTQPSTLWILLTRHITDKDDFANNREFITLLVYKSDGKRVFYPYDPPPYIDGVRINSPHYLCKLNEEPGVNSYTLIVSQYEKNNSIYYTLRVYSNSEFTLTSIVDLYKKEYGKRITGHWKGITAGGCANYPETHKYNPIYQINIDNHFSDNNILIELMGPKQYAVGFEIIAISENIPNAPGAFKRKTSGDFRPGYCVLQLDNISGGIYNLMPCTFHPEKEGPFFLEVSSSSSISVAKLQ
ncbi:calpain-7 [Octopus bimaculoides]|uniref:Calpain catalytic domain-containing protein n=1 Tax=Octopus bimaculoides TaxID=37653 RepID=A0A0L8GKG2_OCTBM|nr:calpain-7 [Octopus bimaculoides]|eukprot:XP_014780312.1 PREDICTED: calpain-7-like [Octopus bimaculoides]